MIKITKKLLILLNSFFLLYYSLQLIVFTDEFTVNNFGLYNHAIAGLSEILGIILFSLSLALILIFLKNYSNQIPLYLTIFTFEFLVSLNLWRYVFTNSPGNTSIEIIMLNAFVFSLASLSMLIVLFIKK
tara:strand:+ start:1590 stop:1979 length:390 start_codon:yes stop_codon:yes gene_type:complete